MVRVFALCFLVTACGGFTPPLAVDAGPGFGHSDGGFDLNDVSFLFPLPATRAVEAQLLGIDALLPKALYSQVPLLIDGRDADQLYGALRVVSARVDPCFPGSTPPAAPTCIKQIRLVAQPMATVDDGGVALTTEDATIHLFYELTAEQFNSAVQALHQLRDQADGRTDGRPLEVHPVMRVEGLTGPYATALKAMITRLCTAQTLRRIAFMHVAAAGNAWRFGAFDLVDGAMVEAKIPRTSELTVQGVQEFGSLEFRNGELQPAAPGDQLRVLLSESSMRLTDDRTLSKALKSALTIENPDRSSPKTIDCASCHVASRARANAERRRKVDTSAWAELFVAPARFDVRRVDAVGDDPKALRAFGYQGRDGAWSLRTINESAMIADALTVW